MSYRGLAESMIQRQTVVIYGRLAADRVRLEAARNGHRGLQVTTVVGMASRLAGGFLRGVDGDKLSILVGRLLRMPRRARSAILNQFVAFLGRE